MKYQLNLTALRCPIPILSAKKALKNLDKNDELMLILNLESAVENFSIFAEENSVSLVEQYYASEREFIVILKK
ncbi:sulfurtransferase TusA family protein [Haemophilus haemolyticus]|uniref:sulfurtransferase TusA family protein n=1 Tax=Haemophilus haemolyticus TaxID=726 RepID=UPI001959DE19|nr:sulfurtransferase TusA family protein [Haemophilus haemolyticus]VTX76922.1 SirA-like protein [Haemophilus haemolyticus]